MCISQLSAAFVVIIQGRIFGTGSSCLFCDLCLLHGMCVFTSANAIACNSSNEPVEPCNLLLQMAC